MDQCLLLLSDLGYESAAPRQQFGGRRGWEPFSSFEESLAQQRARRVRTLKKMRELLQDAHGTPARLIASTV